MNIPEFSRIVRLSEIGSQSTSAELVASEDERQRLAKRFGLPEIASLSAAYELVDGDRGVAFRGVLESDLQQSCVITGDPFPAHIREEFDILFVPRTEMNDPQDEIELSEADCDLVEYEGGQIDLGEAIAQTLYLSLDSFPRGPNADEMARQKGLQSEEEAGPFGALAALKDKLG